MLNWLLFNLQTINLWYAIAGLLVLGLTVLLAYDYFYNAQRIYLRFFHSYIWAIIIVTSIGGASTTLLYSEVFGFIPCSLCWLQRVALYPQALMSVTAYRLKDTERYPLYGIVLSTFGFFVAVYQYIYQSLPQETLQSGLVPCLADGTADCSEKIIEVFGFVTFPFLSAVLFAFLIVLYLNLRRAGKSPKKIDYSIH
jgi:disulfide bond formation protein DsbB